MAWDRACFVFFCAAWVAGKRPGAPYTGSGAVVVHNDCLGAGGSRPLLRAPLRGEVQVFPAAPGARDRRTAAANRWREGGAQGLVRAAR